MILCAGKELEIELPERATLLRWLITFAEVSCHTSALLPGRKLARLIVAEIGAASCLLITMTVIAPSLERIAAKVETLSGLGPEAETLVSPKVDLAPS